MNNENKIKGYANQLKSYTKELRSKLTALMLAIEEDTELKTEQKKCLLKVCYLIDTKNNNLLFTEAQLDQLIYFFDENLKNGQEGADQLIDFKDNA